jgi:HEAT repeat protein
VGLPAAPALVQLMGAQPGRPAAEAERTIGWIVDRAAERPGTRAKAEWLLLNLLIDPRQSAPVRHMAAGLLGRVGRDAVAPALAGLLGRRDLRDEALWSLQQIPGPVALKALTGAYETSPSPDFRAAIVQAVVTRDDRPAALFVRAAADRAPVVRLTALYALAKTADPGTAPFLARRIETSTGEERSAALMAYVMVGRALVARGDTRAAEPIFAAALKWSEDDPPTARAALNSLAGRPEVVCASAIAPFLRSPDPAVQVAAVNALAPMPCRCATMALVSGLRAAPRSRAVAIVTALADRGDPAALPAILAAARVSDPDIRLAALRALGRIGDLSARSAVAAALTDASTPAAVRRAAFDALIALGAAQLRQGHADVARNLYETALGAARNDEDKARAVRGLGQLHSPLLLPTLEPLLQQASAVRDAAAEACLASADTLAASGNPKGAIEAYLRVLDAVRTGPLATELITRLGALGSGVDLGSRQGFITCWWVIGPFPSPNKSAYDRALFPEQEINLGKEYDFEGRKLKWRFVHTTDPSGIVDYLPLFTPNETTACYAYAEVTAPEAKEIRLRSGSDDGIVIWLNGERIFGTNADRSLEVDKDNTEARLKAGKNTVLIKVLNGGGSWNACLRLTDGNDQPIRFEQRCE